MFNCNYFHASRGKIRGNAPLSPPRSREHLIPSGMKFCHEILETLSYHMMQTQSLYLTQS